MCSNNCSRNMNVSETRRPQRAALIAESDQSPEPSCSYSTPSTSTSVAYRPETSAPQRPHGPRSANEQTERATIRKGEEIAALLMRIVEKREKCLDFDLQYWLPLYQTVRPVENFAEASIVISCAAQIYGRKVDYLSDIVIHMNDDQKSRELTEAKDGEADEEGAAEKPKEPNATRKRGAGFNPQSLSDCFDDVEFTCKDKKLLKLEDLIQQPKIVEVDRRSTVEQMRELCTELRMNPSRQRRQQILNRLRDEACIAPITSSHGMARRNQILDFESGESIGTRYDYQIHQNYIDGQTGTLIAEHDLKRFFQRCDVMDYLADQLETERERCTQQGMPAPPDVLSARARELKIYMPPEYLKDRYRINVHDTTDFDDALLQARVTNYSSDPILSLMDPAEKEKRFQSMDLDGHDSGVGNASTDGSGVNSSECATDTTLSSDISFSGVLCSSMLLDTTLGEMDTSQKRTENTTEKGSENPLEDELVALESGERTGEKVAAGGTNTRLSVDEGIGVDRESPPRSSPNSPLAFRSGTVITRQPVPERSVRLLVNLFGLPEKMVQKGCVFALPVEYKKLKMDLVHQRHNLVLANPRINLYSLHPTAPSNPLWAERPSTPELEDFAGFNDEEAPDRCKIRSAKAKNSSHVQQMGEEDFEGFSEEEVTGCRKNIAQWVQLCAKDVTKPVTPLSTPKRLQASEQTSSQPGTPSRTLSCDSGISDSAERSKSASATNSEHEPILSEPEDGGVDALASQPNERTESSGQVLPSKEDMAESHARLQQSVEEARERIEKVNQWHKKLRPILIESEKRNHFDIHAYGTEIIETFDTVLATARGSLDVADSANPAQSSPIITLANVLHNKPAHSTARYFLSMLMLANTNNVEIVNKNLDPLRLSTAEEIQLRLLSRKRHHQEMDALGELLPNDADAEHREHRKRANRKRKLAPEASENQEATSSGIQRPEVSERLGFSSAASEDRTFIDKVYNQLPDMNSEEMKRKRTEFRRSIRNHAYGFVKQNADQDADRDANREPAPTTTSGQKQHEPLLPCSATVEQEAPLPSLEEDDILQVDLLTNHAMLVPARDPDEMCAKSVFSLAESGYESLLSESNICR